MDNEMTSEIQTIENQIEDEIFELTSDQKHFLEVFNEFLIHDDQRMMTLSGRAGSGKSYVAVEAIKIALEHGLTIGVCAPTHKAVRVIRQKIEAAGLNVDAQVYGLLPQQDTIQLKSPSKIYIGTLHQFILAQPVDQKDPEDDDVDFRSTSSYNFLPLFYVDLLICDEASMVGGDFFCTIKDCSERANNQILFIGDEYQLYPIEKNKAPTVSPVFRLPLIVYLKKVVRHSGIILSLANQLQEAMEDGMNVKPYSLEPMNKPGMAIILDRDGFEGSAWMKLVYEYAQLSKDRDYDPDDFRVLVYRRKTMERINQLIRNSLYGVEADFRFFPGEYLFTHGQCSNFIPMANRLENILEGAKQPIAARLGNSRDYKIISSRLYLDPLPIPWFTLGDRFPELVQPLNIVTIRVWNDIAERVAETEFVVLTEKQLAVYAQNKQEVLRVLEPVIAECDRLISQTHKSEDKKELVNKRRVLHSYLVNLAYCYNVAEQKQFIKSGEKIKTEDEDFVIEERNVYSNKKSYFRAICKLQPGYCITTHKAQGTTIEDVFILYQDYWGCYSPDHQVFMDQLYRLFYVGLTRASNSVKIFSKF